MQIVQDLVGYLASVNRLDESQVDFLVETGYYTRPVYRDYDYDMDYGYEAFVEDTTDAGELGPEMITRDLRRRKKGRLADHTGAKERHQKNFALILTERGKKHQ